MMTHSQYLQFLQSGLVYFFLLTLVIVFFLFSWLYGKRARRKLNKEIVEVSSIFITSIFGFFAILIAFQFAGSTRINETQRVLTISEVLSISAVIDSAESLREKDRAEVLKFLSEYITLRNKFYQKPIQLLELDKKIIDQKKIGLNLLHYSYALIPIYDGDQRIKLSTLITQVQSMNKIFDQQAFSLFMLTDRILWQALVCLLVIIASICGYKVGIEGGQQFRLTVIFLVVVFAAIIICLTLGNPRISSNHLDRIDAEFPKLLHRLNTLQ